MAERVATMHLEIENGVAFLFRVTLETQNGIIWFGLTY